MCAIIDLVCGTEISSVARRPVPAGTDTNCGSCRLQEGMPDVRSEEGMGFHHWREFLVVRGNTCAPGVRRKGMFEKVEWGRRASLD